MPGIEQRRKERSVLNRKLGYDDGGRYVLLAISGCDISPTETFGTVFSILDCDMKGEEVFRSRRVTPEKVRLERIKLIGRVMHLNGKEDEFAA